MLTLLAALAALGAPPTDDPTVSPRPRAPKYVAGPAAPPPPPAPASTATACANEAKRDPAKAETTAKAWRDAGGGVPARQCLGMALFGLDRFAEAATTFEQAARDAQLANNREAAALWMPAGNAALAGDEPVRARTAFDRVIDMPGLSDEMKGEVYLDHARANVAANEMAKAKIDLDQATKLVPRDPLAWLLSANLARKLGDMPGAFAAIRQAATLAPGDASIAYEAGNIAAAAGQIEDAKAAWTRAAQADPQSDAGQAAVLALKGDGATPKP